MNPFSRGVKNAFRNKIRTIAVVAILAVAIGLALAMLVAREAVENKITNVKASVGNTVTISPAGMRGGFGGIQGGGSLLTSANVATVKKTAHVASVDETLTATLSSDNTNLTSSIEMGEGMAKLEGGDSSDSSDSNSSSSSSSAPTDDSSDASGDSTTRPKMDRMGQLSVTGTTDPSAASDELANISLKSGDNIDGASDAKTAVIGSQLATKNSLSVGSTFKLYGTDVKVVGILDTSSNQFLGNTILIPLKTLQDLADESGKVSSVTATVDSVSNVDGVVSALKSSLGSSVDVTDDADKLASTISSLESIATTSTFSLIAAVAVAAVIILAIMLMTVRERRREVGVLKAIGARTRTLMVEFAAEAVTITVIAAVVGVGVGVLAGGPITSALTSSATSSSSNAERGGERGGFARPGESSSSSDSSSSSSASTGSSSSSTSAPTPPSGNMGEMFRSAGKNIGAVTASINWTIVLYALAAAIIVAAVGAVAAGALVVKVKPAEAVRAE
jgi:putative ABC transport system permease protein